MVICFGFTGTHSTCYNKRKLSSYTDLMQQRYLKEHRSGRYISLILSKTLYPHLLEVDQAVRERMDTMLPPHDGSGGRHRGTESP